MMKTKHVSVNVEVIVTQMMLTLGSLHLETQADMMLDSATQHLESQTDGSSVNQICGCWVSIAKYVVFVFIGKLFCNLR